jgi:hypothetical protein
MSTDHQGRRIQRITPAKYYNLNVVGLAVQISVLAREQSQSGKEFHHGVQGLFIEASSR